MNRFFFWIVFGVVCVLIVALLVWGMAVRFWHGGPSSFSSLKPVACTMEAKQCPDGSHVGRSGPRCEFAACPEPSVPADWSTTTDTSTHITFSYPLQWSTGYLHPQVWPPRISVSDRPFVCIERGSGIEPEGRVERRLVDNRVYCVTRLSEGAAGTIYTQYMYVFARQDKTVSLGFTVRAVQCFNFNDPQKTACEHERETFDLDLDRLVDQIAGTVR